MPPPRLSAEQLEEMVAAVEVIVGIQSDGMDFPFVAAAKVKLQQRVLRDVVSQIEPLPGVALQMQRRSLIFDDESGGSEVLVRRVTVNGKCR